jgi:SAM-dependent methyltransferase
MEAACHVKASFLEFARCPKCGGPLNINDAVYGSGDEIEEARLVCSASGCVWPVKRGVPRFVASDAYARNFTLEWTLHRHTQLDRQGGGESECTFAQKTGFQPSDLQRKLVLDVGCGAGRFSEVATRWGATVVGIDLSGAVDAAHANLAARRSFHGAQADVFQLPFAPLTFDVIFSIGVLDHTPSTEKAFRCLPSLLKPGGKLAVWVYSSYSPLYKVSDVYRRVTTKLPSRFLYKLCEGVSYLHPLWQAPILGMLLRTALPVSIHPKRDWRVLDTFDWYSPKYQWKHTYAELFKWFRAEGLTDIAALDCPVSLSGSKPVA